MSETNSILKRINALLNKTVENGATEAEAASALQMAQKLMTQHMIEESQLSEFAKDKKCQTISCERFKTAYDTDALNGAIADAFDCKVWWQRTKVHFFGFGEDARLASYFYSYLNNAVVNESEKYKKSVQFYKQKRAGCHGRSILSSFRKGMLSRLIIRLDDLKQSRVSNIVKSTGKNLVIVKTDQVNDEYQSLNLKCKSKKVSWDVPLNLAYRHWFDKGDGVNMAGGIEESEKPLHLSEAR